MYKGREYCRISWINIEDFFSFFFSKGLEGQSQGLSHKTGERNNEQDKIKTKNLK